MLRFAFGGALAALLLVSARPVRAAEEDKEARAIIAKAIAAQGGEANLAKFNTSIAKFKGKFHGPVGDGDMTGTIQSQAPDKVRLELKLNIGGMDIAITQVADGNKGWRSVNGMTQELDKDALAESREKMHAGRVADLQGLSDKGIKLSSLGEAKVGDKAAVGVRVARAGYRDVNLYFDKDKGLLLKSETRSKDEMSGTEFTEEKLYDDYRKVSDILVAHKVQEKHDGKEFAETEITEINPVEKHPDGTFAKP
jgi:hypothetical protein